MILGRLEIPRHQRRVVAELTEDLDWCCTDHEVLTVLNRKYSSRRALGPVEHEAYQVLMGAAIYFGARLFWFGAEAVAARSTER